MLRGHRAGSLSVRSDRQSEIPPLMQQDASPGGSPVGQPQPPPVRVGAGVLSEETRRRQEPRMRVALSGPALAEDPVEDVADQHALRRGDAHA